MVPAISTVENQYSWLLKKQINKFHDLSAYKSFSTKTEQAKAIWGTENNELWYYEWECIFTFWVRKQRRHFEEIFQDFRQFRWISTLSQALISFFKFTWFSMIAGTLKYEPNLWLLAKRQFMIGLCIAFRPTPKTDHLVTLKTYPNITISDITGIPDPTCCRYMPNVWSAWFEEMAG